MSEPARSRSVIDRMETSLTSLESRLNGRFDELQRGHNRLEDRIDHVSKSCNATAVIVARIEGERTVERRMPTLGKRLTLWSSIVGGVVAAFAGLAAAWASLTGHVPTPAH